MSENKTKVHFILQVIGNMLERLNLRMETNPESWKAQVEEVASKLESHANELRRLVRE
jgi:hypothetical protein